MQNYSLYFQLSLISLQFLKLFKQPMDSDPLTIYKQLQQPTSSLIDTLMSESGQAMLDREILQMRDQMGEEQFAQFAQQFFKNTNINYKTFFKKGEQINKELSIVNQKDQHPTFLTNAEKEEKSQEIYHKQQTKVEEEEQILQNVPQQQQQHTNNSQQIDDQYEEIQKNDLGKGRFCIKYKNGDSYEGQMEEGKKSGWGEYIYQSGQKYAGCFIDDQINGYGRYYFLSGADYEGDWSSGMKHGIGILKFANQDQYEGSFSNDDLHGKGVYHYSNGDIFQGKFKFGKRHGTGTFSGSDGRIQKGQWINDIFQV